MKVSVIIPTYNEEKVIVACLESLKNQTYKDMEIIVVDDGSSDKTWDVLSEIRNFKQQHKGPGVASNLGAKHAKGEILVFVDADMTFDPHFVEKLVEPIINGKTIGTFSKDEFVANKDNVWSKCWNINKNLPSDRMHPSNYPNSQSVFRAILKKEFLKVAGFDPIGYVDDYTLSEKLGVQAQTATGAIFYHKNPASLKEVFTQARWVGKSEYKRRKIKNEFVMRFVAMIRYSLPFSLINGIRKAIQFNLPQFIFFKMVFDLAVEMSLVGSFFTRKLYR